MGCQQLIWEKFENVKLSLSEIREAGTIKHKTNDTLYYSAPILNIDLNRSVKASRNRRKL